MKLSFLLLSVAVIGFVVLVMAPVVRTFASVAGLL